jgi:hypothetical protein
VLRRLGASRHVGALSRYAHTYYAAAVRSMSRSWHNFFFAAAVQTISSTCTVIRTSVWSPSSSTVSGVLYDCAGKADAIAHAR